MEHKIHIAIPEPFYYIHYISIMTALRQFGKGRVVLWYREEPDNEYYALLRKNDNFEFNKIDEKTGITMTPDDVLGHSAMLYLDEFTQDDIDQMKQQHPLYEHAAIGEFEDKDIKMIPVHVPNSAKDLSFIDPSYVETVSTVISVLIRKLLVDRVYNPFKVKPKHNIASVPRKGQYRFHLLGLVHLPTSEKYMSCAFTQKNVKMCKMLLDLGHEVYLYGSEGSDAPCTKLIETHTLEDIRDAWGEGDNRYDIGYNWETKQFKHDINAKPAPVRLKFYQNSINAINRNKRPDDFLMITQGNYQKPVDEAVQLYLTIESGIGYRGSYCKFRSFESTYIQNFTYGSEHPRQSINGNFYDRVMPNYFDTKDFPFRKEKEDFYLFMGRLIIRKGLRIAEKAVGEVGGKLLVAGQQSNEIKVSDLGDHCEYVGFADVNKRADLMGRARAVFCPSTYLEPFCGVHAESMLCGTPVITTNFGAFTDYVVDGLNGYRCNTLNDFVKAAKDVEKLDPVKIRKYADRFTMKEVGRQYQRWFDDLHDVWESTVDPSKQGWHRIRK